MSSCSSPFVDDVEDVDVEEAVDVDADVSCAEAGCADEDGASPKLGDGRGASVGKRERREPGVWPLKKLSGVARAERRRARMACPIQA